MKIPVVLITRALTGTGRTTAVAFSRALGLNKMDIKSARGTAPGLDQVFCRVARIEKSCDESGEVRKCRTSISTKPCRPSSRISAV
jgi:hypothetical protein